MQELKVDAESKATSCKNITGIIPGVHQALPDSSVQNWSYCFKFPVPTRPHGNFEVDNTFSGSLYTLTLTF